jgi:hypothetical protein
VGKRALFLESAVMEGFTVESQKGVKQKLKSNENIRGNLENNVID